MRVHLSTGSVRARHASVRTSVKTVPKISPVDSAARSFSMSPLPNVCAISTEMPEQPPKRKNTTIDEIGAATLTAARE